MAVEQVYTLLWVPRHQLVSLLDWARYTGLSPSFLLQSFYLSFAEVYR